MTRLSAQELERTYGPDYRPDLNANRRNQNITRKTLELHDDTSIEVAFHNNPKNLRAVMKSSNLAQFGTIRQTFVHKNGRLQIRETEAPSREARHQLDAWVRAYDSLYTAKGTVRDKSKWDAMQMAEQTWHEFVIVYRMLHDMAPRGRRPAWALEPVGGLERVNEDRDFELMWNRRFPNKANDPELAFDVLFPNPEDRKDAFDLIFNVDPAPAPVAPVPVPVPAPLPAPAPVPVPVPVPAPAHAPARVGPTPGPAPRGQKRTLKEVIVLSDDEGEENERPRQKKRSSAAAAKTRDMIEISDGEGKVERRRKKNSENKSLGSIDLTQ
ncbi:hypothetical protein C8F01DRAFT_1084489 [Mycena amicta]|nr:hypothetical protein C8F01DRAFT_1084489 [Mycena amicta]